MLAENVEGIANATETVEMLNQAQENLQEVAKNPGIVGTWLQGLIPDLLNFAFQVVVAIIIYIVGSKIINLILKCSANPWSAEMSIPVSDSLYCH